MADLLTLPRILLAAVCAVLLGAMVLLADWWIAVPEGKTAQYVGRRQCQRCHQKECELCDGSDHDRAMDLATPETVLGDFNDRQFTHVALEDLPKLAREDMHAVARKVDPSLWATALQHAHDRLKREILDGLPEQTASLVESQTRKGLAALRPCDATEAQDRIARTVRELKEAGEIVVDFGVTSRFSRRGEKFYVTTDGPHGRMQRYEIKYTFGFRPLQQYLVELEGGRVQCLPLAWDTQQRRWFHLYPAEAVPAGDRLHWTGPLQNWNYMCAECHSTNLKKNYHLAAGAYRTRFSEIDVSCETCHGPGSIHVELADSYGLFWDRRIGYGLPSLKGEDPRVEIETCAPCHSRRRVVHPGFTPGGSLLDHYLPELLDGNLYYADGQILEEDYVYGSFIQSRMYRQGVRCTDCHDPHTTRVKHTDPKAPWNAVPDNRLCTGCHMDKHPAGKYDTPAHHHHPDASKPGTRCVECHMPETKYMVVDPRRDHSLRNPRADLTVSLGIPNACNGCHHDQSKGETAQWAEQWLQKWYGRRKGPRHFAYALAAGREGRPEGEVMLEEITRRKDVPEMVRASALLLLARYPSDTVRTAAMRSLKDPDPVVRQAALQSLQQLHPAGLQAAYRTLAPMLSDPVRAVRIEAVRVLSRTPPQALAGTDRRAFDAAVKECVAGLEYLNDQPGAHLQMGVLHENLGRVAQAKSAYQTAIRIDPKFYQGLANLAVLCGTHGEKTEAAATFKKAIQAERDVLAEIAQYGLDPTEVTLHLAQTHYSFALMLAEDPQQFDRAAEQLAEAVRLAPYDPRMRYNYGLVLQELDRVDQAEKQFLAAHKLAPRAFDYPNALVHLYLGQQRWTRAVESAKAFLDQYPRDPQRQGLLEYARRQSATRQSPPQPE